MKRRWMTIRSHGSDWRVLVVDEKSCPEIANAQGLTCTNTHTIFINAVLPQSAAEAVLLHECLHLIAYEGGLQNVLGTIFPSKKISVYDREEICVAAIAPHLWAILADNRIAKFPKLPKGRHRKG